MRHLRLLFHMVEVAQAGSIRKAAERLNLTPSAMNRRIQDLEAEIGAALFERRARGVRLTTAGEMFIRYARSQIAEASQLKSQVEDLRGLRRGPVQIACSQALAHDFLAERVAAFQASYPRVAFDVTVANHEQALLALAAYEAELALVYRPSIWPSLRVIASVPQRLVAIVRADHPLASRKILRLSECAAYPVALPDRSLGGRQLLDEVATKRDLHFNMLAESNSFEMLRGLVFRCNMVSFQIEIGRPSGDLGMGLVGRPIDTRDVPAADLVLCQLRGRNLPVAAATFAEMLAQSLGDMRSRSA
jgi:DNA-binding transcriptional LysR family regulator